MISAQTAEVIGSAVHCWVLVNAEARHMIDLRQIPALWELPCMHRSGKRACAA